MYVTEQQVKAHLDGALTAKWKNWKGTLRVPTKGSPLVRRFFEIVNERRITIAAVASRSGIVRNTIFQWRHTEPKLANLEAALNVLGYRLAIVPLDQTSTDK